MVWAKEIFMCPDPTECSGASSNDTVDMELERRGVRSRSMQR